MRKDSRGFVRKRMFLSIRPLGAKRYWRNASIVRLVVGRVLFCFFSPFSLAVFRNVPVAFCLLIWTDSDPLLSSLARDAGGSLNLLAVVVDFESIAISIDLHWSKRREACCYTSMAFSADARCFSHNVAYHSEISRVPNNSYPMRIWIEFGRRKERKNWWRSLRVWLVARRFNTLISC